MRLLTALLATTLLATPALAGPDFAPAVEADYAAHLEKLFVDFHKNPELSFKEARTAAIMAKELRAVPGIVVTEKVGGTGVVGVMKNGDGPVLLVRADMDGLPLKEDSGVAYPSTVTQVDIDGTTKPVMHACGHDVHITSMIGTARQLARLRDRWRGTVVFVVQPGEERIDGARRMLADGLYTRFPKPDYAVAFHVTADMPTGKLSLEPGISSSSSDSVDITIPGIGTHGASPHQGKDPIVMGAQIVMALQTLVSREIAPLKPGVVTVGSFHSGFKHNIISDKAELQLTVRSDDEDTRKKLLDGIKRIAANVGRMNGMPEDKLPTVKVGFESTPVTLNDPALTGRVRSAFTSAFGEDVMHVEERTGMGAEDFAYFIQKDLGVPGAYFVVGGTPQADLDADKAGGKPVPAHHSPFFRIDPKPSVTLGTQAMTVAVLDLLKR
ncbi:amidohydrolase [Sphingomonas turrisvirgatae]|uniref:Peptidase M20 n=1 Tax=Sphingomonas turrisvirgatae TaxID=1888892 RepID=A0A1E3LT68_9SPHN|nr:amidohydrolase [Sphingomonas turrisvirgatae]ODP36923.1 peptidase M20 [Sphingomonas turrisvirgatae]